ncbi:hypothetical protein [Streptomyces sp. SM13]|uniref:hypothetical protein n=1 Tax=Streptomyces sp. SM13 TaxID=1983803 RepID=UPI0015E1A9C8
MRTRSPAGFLLAQELVPDSFEQSSHVVAGKGESAERIELSDVLRNVPRVRSVTTEGFPSWLVVVIAHGVMLGHHCRSDMRGSLLLRHGRRRPYLSDLTDEQRGFIEPVITGGAPAPNWMIVSAGEFVRPCE